MTTVTLTKNKFDILKTYGSEMIISIDKHLWNEIYSEHLEDQEMKKNKKKLVKKYGNSIKS
jgi:hypothetical protein